ncbi:unnamed protein product [Cyprideis torosa]|uniref:Uncharacterized protein n=1 Tax=Cyprideis torosa TaxID=163714 RepID=A0A7R8ZKU3_9CRUS|nr:unnamed protein product [Cyprideis torosa]CAG0882301.1 unnamed protein product [Cyprideis torosa]
MAEARSAAAHFNVPPDPELAKSDLHEILVSTRRSLVRYYYRTRNSIRNGTWPTSLNNLGIAFMLIVSLLLCDVEMVQTPKSALWRLSENQFFSWIAPLSFPRLLRALLFSSLLAVCFFIVLMAVRQLILRALLRYRGWMHQRLRKPSWRMILWGTVVKLVSGYKPSLYSTQRSLPRMVVPPLQDTIRLTLESLEPIVDEEELEQLRREAEVFKAELAPKLQRVLVLKSWWAQNYVSDWW